jgi:hypothetical protein
VEFDHRTLDRHSVGQMKYGAFSFLEKDMIEEAILEALDFANYMRYAFIKLRMIQMALAEDPRIEKLADGEGNITIGVDSFKGSGS